MQIASARVALGGDRRHIVPKAAITPAEAAILELVHGEGAVTDIVIHGEEDRKSRDELERLNEAYPGDPNQGKGPVARLFPGVGASLPQTFEDLGLEDATFAEGFSPKKAPAKRAPRDE